MPFYTILQQIGILSILALIGILGVRSGILKDEARLVLEKLVFYITLPLLIITKLSTLEVTPEVLQNGFKVILFTYVILFLQIGAGKISARLLRLPRNQAVIHSMHTFLGNIVFLGFPLLDALFPGGEAILYAALYQLVMNTILWTYGVAQLDSGQKGGVRKNVKKMLNPNTIALLIGLLMMLLNIRLPGFLMDSLGGLGSTTLYLAMIYIGILLAGSNPVKMVRKTDVLFLSLNKLLLLPGVLLLLFYLLFQFSSLSMNSIAFSTLILEASMPCMTILVLLAKRYGADDRKAMENFVVSTVFSIVTLPLVIAAIQFVVRIL